jgi:hypothetical protein
MLAAILQGGNQQISSGRKPGTLGAEIEVPIPSGQSELVAVGGYAVGVASIG